MRLRSLSFFITLCLAGSLLAQEPEPSPPDGSEKVTSDAGSPAIVREKTVYVPYGKLDDVFERADRGIFLPYEEFLRLWHAAQPRPPEPGPVKPPADGVIRGGRYSGTVNGSIARFEVDYQIEALKEGWSELPLAFSNVAVESVTLSNPAALFSSEGGSYRLFLPERGKYDARLNFSVRITSSPGKKELEFGIPPVAVSQLSLTIPEEEVRVTVEPQMAATTTVHEGGATKLSAFVGNASSVKIGWTPPASKVTEDGAVIFAEQFIRSYLGERIVRLRSEIRYQVERGEADTFRIETPDQMGLLKVEGENLRVWDLKDDLLTVTLHSPARGAYSLKLDFERILEQTPETLSLPLPVVRDVRRESGWISLSHDPALKIRVSSSTGLSQRDPQEVPENLRSELQTGFRYLAPPPPLGLDVETITPLVRTRTTSVMHLGQEEDT